MEEYNQSIVLIPREGSNFVQNDNISFELTVVNFVWEVLGRLLNKNN